MLYIPGVDSLLELDEDLTISNLLKLGMQSLVEAQCEAVLSELLNVSPFDLYKNLDTSISNEIAREYWLRISLIVLNSVFNKSKSDIINMINFCGNIFMINDNVLTPHLQTQEITYAAIGYIKELFSQEKKLSSLDMCCGCGAIGLSIKSAIPQTDMTAVDISKDALDVLQFNAKRLGLSVTSVQGDLFNNIQGKYDIICVNPPYLFSISNIPSEVKEISNSGNSDVVWFQGILSGEPEISMLAGDNGFQFYNKIFEKLNDFLKPKSLAVLEFGGESQLQELNRIIINNLNDSEIYYLYSSKGASPRAAFIFRGVPIKDIEYAIPKVLKLIPNIQTPLGKNRFNICEPSIKKFGK